MHGFETMFGHGAWLAQLSGLLLVLAMFDSASVRMRIGLIASACAALAYALASGHHTSLGIWAGLVIAVNTLKLAQVDRSKRKARFSERDEHLRRQMLPGLTGSQARTLIDAGNWISGKAGERLMSEGEPAAHLFFLHQGTAAVSLSGAAVGHCDPGDLIGDATAISGAPATATVNLIEAGELWCIWADDLRQFLDLHPDARTVLERVLNDALRSKLSSANQRIAQTGS